MLTSKPAIKALLTKFNSVEHMANWIEFYLGIRFPVGHISDDSNSSPLEAMFEAYCNFRDDKYATTPGYIWLSARDCYKTLSESILNVIIMIHFGIPIAHMAAIKNQSKKSIQYVNNFIRKIKEVLDANEIKITSSADSRASLRLKDGLEVYINIIICNLAGANSEHCPYVSYDELDTIAYPSAYEESRAIACRFNGKGPLTVKCSTRKFAFGIMSQEIDNAPKTGERVLQWNILDVTEYCKPERHLPDSEWKTVYVHKNLPLRTITQEDYDFLQPVNQLEYNAIEAPEGCRKCPLLPVCKKHLFEKRTPQDTGGLYKTIDQVIITFKKMNPDMAEAQLMCWKPSQSGLVYPRFAFKYGAEGNLLSLEEAYRNLSFDLPKKEVTMLDIQALLMERNIRTHSYIDWGYGGSHAFSMIVGAIMPNGDWWLIDTFVMTEVEFPDMEMAGKDFKEKYNLHNFIPDTANPLIIKEFKKQTGIKAFTDFKKDVPGGIESVRDYIVDASNKRRLKVLVHTNNDPLLVMFKQHHFKLDANGEPTKTPDDDEVSADCADALRYGAQYHSKKKKKREPDKQYKISEGMKLESQLTPQEQEFKKWADEQLKKEKEKTSNNLNGESGSLGWDFNDYNNEDDE